MGIVAKPIIFIAGTAILAADINNDFDTLYAEFNGNIDNTNIKAGANIDAAKLLAASITNAKLADAIISDSKIDFTSARILRPGVAGLKFARGAKAYTFAAATNVSVTVTFSTDSDDGNPVFTATPEIIITPVHAFVAVTLFPRITARSASSFTFRVDASGANSESGTMMWYAVGA